MLVKSLATAVISFLMVSCSAGPIANNGSNDPVFEVDPANWLRSAPHSPPTETKKEPDLEPILVWWKGQEEPGTIVIDVRERFLYLVQKDIDGRLYAKRYSVGVGRQGFQWSGTAHVAYRRDWPAWCPPSEMIGREPNLRMRLTYVPDRDCLGIPGGSGSPLGAHALYLHDENGQDTMYRIHGTDKPWTIGRADSSGCIRMLNKHVKDLSERVPNGTTVIVR